MLPRLLLLHKQSSSGRLHFFCLSSGILAFNPVAALAELRDEAYSPTVQCHPTAVIREAEVQLGLPEGGIEAVPDFQAWIDTPGGDVPVLLAAFTGIDPPFAMAERTGGRFIAITESRHLSELERNLLRRAYEHVLG